MYVQTKFGQNWLTTTVRSLSETSKRTAYMQVLFDVSERERTVVDCPKSAF